MDVGSRLKGRLYRSCEVTQRFFSFVVTEGFSHNPVEPGKPLLKLVSSGSQDENYRLDPGFLYMFFYNHGNWDPLVYLSWPHQSEGELSSRGLTWQTWYFTPERAMRATFSCGRFLFASKQTWTTSHRRGIVIPPSGGRCLLRSVGRFVS